MNRRTYPVYVDMGVFKSICIGHAIVETEAMESTIVEVQISDMKFVKDKKRAVSQTVGEKENEKRINL